MKRNNLFDGESYRAMFAIIIYKWLLTHKWFTYADIMADYMNLKSAKDLPCSISKCEHVKELTKALCEIRQVIGEEHFKIEGNNRNRRFRYIGKDNDPLADMRNAKVINNLRQYWKFCQDSAGFFTKSWLEYFFKDCQDLLEMKARKLKGQQVISASIDRILTNIEYLPMLYEAIVNKQVLEIDYKPYGVEQETLIFHPNFLKEYNGRWNLFVHAEGHSPENGYNIPLDRIQTRPREKSKIEYIPAPSMFYERFFRDIVGVSHTKDTTKYDIVLRAHTYYIYKLTETKPIHQSQSIASSWGDHEDGTYGDFSLEVEVNNEFFGRILQLGAGLEIVSPKEVRDLFKQRVKDLAKLYE